MISKEEKSILINVERFVVVSGQKNFLMEQKQHLNDEVARLNILYKKNYYRKREWKARFAEKQQEILNMIKKYESEILKYQERVMLK